MSDRRPAIVAVSDGTSIWFELRYAPIGVEPRTLCVVARRRPLAWFDADLIEAEIDRLNEDLRGGKFAAECEVANEG